MLVLTLLDLKQFHILYDENESAISLTAHIRYPELPHQHKLPLDTFILNENVTRVVACSLITSVTCDIS